MSDLVGISYAVPVTCSIADWRPGSGESNQPRRFQPPITHLRRDCLQDRRHGEYPDPILTLACHGTNGGATAVVNGYARSTSVQKPQGANCVYFCLFLTASVKLPTPLILPPHWHSHYYTAVLHVCCGCGCAPRSHAELVIGIENTTGAGDDSGTSIAPPGE